jgi:hypothetical protein
MKLNPDIYFHTFFPFFFILFTSFLVLTTVSRWWYISQKRGIHKNPCFKLCSTSILHLILDTSFSTSLVSVFDFIYHLLFNPTFDPSLEFFLLQYLIRLISFWLTFHFNSCTAFQLASIFNSTPVLTTFHFNRLLSPTTFALSSSSTSELSFPVSLALSYFCLKWFGQTSILGQCSEVYSVLG